MEPSISNDVFEKAAKFINHNSNYSEEAGEYLSVLSLNGNVKNCDLQCDAIRFEQLANSARYFGLVNEHSKASNLMKEELVYFLSGFTEFKEIYDRAKKRIEPIRAVHEKAINFLDSFNIDFIGNTLIATNDTKYDTDISKRNNKQDTVRYLAVLALKGEVQASDLGNNRRYFSRLNSKARNLGLISQGGFFSEKKGIITGEVKETLQKFFTEGAMLGNYSDKDLRSVFDSVKREYEIEGLTPAMIAKGWKKIVDSSEDVANIECYLKRKTEKELPGHSVKVYYGEPTKGEDWKEPTFFVNLQHRDNGASVADVEKIRNKLKKVFPDLEGDSGICVRIDESGKGVCVYGKPELLVAKIMEKDKEGYKSLGKDKGVYLV